MRPQPLFLGFHGRALRLGVLAALLLAVWAGVGHAQTAGFKSLDVQVWPEYDRPLVLLIYSGELADGVSFPQRVRVLVPEGAAVHAVAYPGPAGNLLTLPWSTEADPAGQAVVFDLDQAKFVVEVYADLLSALPDRSFSLDLVAPVDVAGGAVTLRQPSRASELTTTPAMQPGAADSLGNPTYTLALGALKAGERQSLQVSYRKADAEPSLNATPLPAGGLEPAPAASPDGQGNQWLLWVIVALGLALAGMMAALLLSGRANAADRSRQARRKMVRERGEKSPARPSAAPKMADNRFCVQCGQEFAADDRFCRQCGAKRR